MPCCRYAPLSSQFEQQFYDHEHSAVADIIHVTEYLCEAGKSIVGPNASREWGLARKALLLEGQVQTVMEDLKAHQCSDDCHRDVYGTCLAKVAIRYLTNHKQYLDYPAALQRELSVGSGEAESGIRHLVRFRIETRARGFL